MIAFQVSEKRATDTKMVTQLGPGGNEWGVPWLER